MHALTDERNWGAMHGQYTSRSSRQGLGLRDPVEPKRPHQSNRPDEQKSCHRENMMTDTITPRLHPAAGMYAAEFKAGLLSRREFLTRTTALGVATATAYSLGGLGSPAKAQAAAKRGGTLRIQQSVLALKDPRTADWSEIGILSRGWLEYLVQYERDGSFTPMLLESWEVNDNATEYLLKLRPGVKWNNGEDWTADNLLWLLNYWCDKTVEGNSMPGRLAGLVDETTNKARDGAIVVVDPLTVKITLPAPDIAIIPGFSDYPAAVIHPATNLQDILATPIGTGAYLPESTEVGVKSVLVKNTAHTYWGPDAYLDRIEFIDYGTDPASWVAAVDSGEVDMLYQNVTEFIGIVDDIGWTKSEVVTGATIVARFNQVTEENGKAPYADARVRQALSQAVDNGIVLELGYNNLGVQADNHHVAPVHPEYADIGRPKYDPAGAKALLTEAGMGDYEFELTTLDDGFGKNSGDAIAAQIRDAGIAIKRTVLPGATFWNDWTKYPFSITEWNHRPLGVQILALAYRSGEAWNEAAFNNAEFDAKLAQAMSIADADKRSEVMAVIEKILQDQAVFIQPYWRSLYRHYKPEVVGAEMHPSFEIHVHKLGLSA
jgi:peptide/nickel transport system substrate-binding protein